MKYLILALLMALPAAADTATISWDASPAEYNVTSYKVYLGDVSRTYTQTFEVTGTTFVIPGIDLSKVNFVNVMAINAAGESGFGEELVIQAVPDIPPPPTGLRLLKVDVSVSVEVPVSPSSNPQ